jgi:CAAX protease family protein
MAIQGAARVWAALAGCVVLLGLTAILVDTIVPARAYPLVNTAVAGALIAIALSAGTTAAAIGLTIGRRTVLAAVLGLASVTAVLATGWALPPIREVFTASPAATITSADLLWAVLIRVPFGTVLLEEVAFRGVLPALLGADGQRWRWRSVLGASVLFGLFHLLPAIKQGQCDALAVHSLFCPAGPVLGPAAVMIVAMGLGILLCVVRHVGGGLLAPFAVHTAANSAGYVLAWIA